MSQQLVKQPSVATNVNQAAGNAFVHPNSHNSSSSAAAGAARASTINTGERTRLSAQRRPQQAKNGPSGSAMLGRHEASARRAPAAAHPP